jgi:hypothetical protein
VSHSAYPILVTVPDAGAGPRGDGAEGNRAVWSVIVAVIAGLVLSDYLFSFSASAALTRRRCAKRRVWAVGETSMGVGYFACYVSNEALSIDNFSSFYSS